MHLKNFSMWLSDMGWMLSPAYDLLNVKLILPNDDDDTALLLGGKKKNFDKGYFDRFGAVLKLNDKQINSVYKKLDSWLPKAIELIDNSFLNENNKLHYKELISERVGLFLLWNALRFKNTFCECLVNRRVRMCFCILLNTLSDFTQYCLFIVFCFWIPGQTHLNKIYAWICNSLVRQSRYIFVAKVSEIRQKVQRAEI